MDYLLLSIFVVGVTALYLNFKLPRTKEFDRIISFFLFTVTFHALYVFIYVLLSLPRYIETGFPQGLLYGPIFYVALSTYFGTHFSGKQILLHLSPFLLGFIFFVTFIFSTSFQESFYETYHFVLYLLISISLIGYVSLGFYSNRKQIQSESPHQTFRLISIGITALVTLGLFTLSVALTRLEPMVREGAIFPRIVIYSIKLLMVIFVLEFQVRRLLKNNKAVNLPMGVKQPLQNAVNGSLATVPEEGNLLYDKSLISESLMDVYEQRLKKLEKNKVFLVVNLSLGTLAKRISAPKHHLSQLFTVRMDTTFNKYVNGLRVQYACELMKQNSKPYTMEELAYECGFNTRVSFQRNFKIMTGMPPSAYRHQVLGSKETIG